MKIEKISGDISVKLNYPVLMAHKEDSNEYGLFLMDNLMVSFKTGYDPKIMSMGISSYCFMGEITLRFKNHEDLDRYPRMCMYHGYDSEVPVLMFSKNTGILIESNRFSFQNVFNIDYKVTEPDNGVVEITFNKMGKQ